MSGESALIKPPIHPTVTKVIVPPTWWRWVNLQELWQYRELFVVIAWRDITLRYKQTLLGAAWAIIQPLMVMLVFNVIFGRLGRMSDRVDVAYPVFVFASLLPWTLFSTTINRSTNSLLLNVGLITKIYFPRLLIPLSSVGCGVVDFANSLIVLIGLMVVYDVPIHPQMLLAPLFVMGSLMFAVGVGTLLSAIVVRYRDVTHALTFVVQLWLLASPVAYPESLVPEQWRALYALNPMAGMISGFRSSILGDPYQWDMIAVSAAAGTFMFLFGLFQFRRMEWHFADII